MLAMIGFFWVVLVGFALPGVFMEDAILNAVRELYDWLVSPLFTVTVKVHKHKITKTSYKTKPDIKDWDIQISDDETQILWNGQVTDTSTTEKILWFGDANDIALFQEDVINYRVHLGTRRFSTYLEECDFIPSQKCPVNWKESLKGAFKTDALGRSEFYWL